MFLSYPSVRQLIRFSWIDSEKGSDHSQDTAHTNDLQLQYTRPVSRQSVLFGDIVPHIQFPTKVQTAPEPAGLYSAPWTRGPLLTLSTSTSGRHSKLSDMGTPYFLLRDFSANQDGINSPHLAKPENCFFPDEIHGQRDNAIVGRSSDGKLLDAFRDSSSAELPNTSSFVIGSDISDDDRESTPQNWRLQRGFGTGNSRRDSSTIDMDVDAF